MTTPDLSKASPPSPPDAVLLQLLFGAVLEQCVSVAAKLGIADLLAPQPKTAAELAVETKTHEPSLYRVLRTLSAAGVFIEDAAGKFGLTPVGALLRSDSPNSMRDFAILFGQEWMWEAWGELLHSVKTGESASKKVHGMGSFEFFQHNKEAGNIFNRAMTSHTRRAVPPIVEAYDFSGTGKLVDIAGGHGLLLAGFLKANPRLQGILFDMPYVIADAAPLLEKEGVRQRVELLSGDFFQSVPAGADAYLMKHIIHDWDDDHCIKILQNIHSAMNKNGKVLIVEMVVPPGNQPSPSKLLDIQMLLVETGKERTPDEYRKLLAASGFALTRIIPTKSPYSIVEAQQQR